MVGGAGNSYAHINVYVELFKDTGHVLKTILRKRVLAVLHLRVASERITYIFDIHNRQYIWFVSIAVS